MENKDIVNIIHNMNDEGIINVAVDIDIGHIMEGVHNFDKIMDIDEEDHVLSEDSDCSEDLEEIRDKAISTSEQNALNGNTKICAIFYYYSNDDAFVMCASCMTQLRSEEHMYAMRKHVIKLRFRRPILFRMQKSPIPNFSMQYVPNVHAIRTLG